MTFFSSEDMGRGAGCGTPLESSVAAIGRLLCLRSLRHPASGTVKAFLETRLTRSFRETEPALTF